MKKIILLLLLCSLIAQGQVKRYSEIRTKSDVSQVLNDSSYQSAYTGEEIDSATYLSLNGGFGGEILSENPYQWNNFNTTRIFVDYTNGADTNNGFSWANAKATLTGAFADLPTNSRAKVVMIILKTDSAVTEDVSGLSLYKIPKHLYIWKPTKTMVSGATSWSFYSNNETVVFTDSIVTLSSFNLADDFTPGFMSVRTIGDNHKVALGQLVFDGSTIIYSTLNLLFEGVMFTNANLQIGGASRFIDCSFSGTGNAITIKNSSHFMEIYGGGDGDYETGWLPTVSGKTVFSGYTNMITLDSRFRHARFELSNIYTGGTPIGISSSYNNSILHFNRNSYSQITSILNLPSKCIAYFNDQIVYKGLPTSDPGIPGALWLDTSASNVIKVSP